MWYVVKTDFDSEETARKELGTIPCVKATYLPYRRVKVPKINDPSRNPFRPTISGILFINVLKKDLNELKSHLKPSGFFIDDKGKQFDGNAHLLSFSNGELTLDDRISMAKVSSVDINLFRTLNEQKDAETFLENVEIVDSSIYDKLSPHYDRVCILNGPFFKFQGFIKQNLDKKRKDRQLYIRLGAWTMVVPNIRKYNYIVVREAPDGEKTKTVNTWRYIDHVIGKLQATYFPDNAGEALRNILTCLGKGLSLDDTRQQLLRTSLNINDNNKKSGTALQAAFLASADSKTESCIEALNSYFRSSGESLEKGLSSLIPDVRLRPFLTPTPGKDFPDKDAFTLLEHKDFTEVILRLDLKKVFVDERYKSPKGIKLAKDDYVYYAHIGLRQSNDKGKLTAFINWGGFVSDFLLMEADERKALTADMEKKGYKHTPTLLNSGMAYRQSPELSGFKVSIEADAARLIRQLSTSQRKPLSLSLVRSLYPVVKLLRQAIPAAVELWQIPRLDSWRKLTQRYVLLHKMPLT